MKAEELPKLQSLFDRRKELQDQLKNARNAVKFEVLYSTNGPGKYHLMDFTKVEDQSVADAIVVCLTNRLSKVETDIAAMGVKLD